MSGYLAALAITLAVEVPVYALLLHSLVGVPLPRAAVAGAAVTLVTHPLAFAVLSGPLADALGLPAAVLLLELESWGVESALLIAWLRREPVVLAAISLVANALSLVVGLVALGWIRP